MAWRINREIAPLREFNDRFPVLIVIVWALLYLQRPFQLGFYSDDWWSLVEPIRGNAPFSFGRLMAFTGLNTGYGSRPVLGFFAFWVSSFAGSSAAVYQCASVLLVLAAAVSFRRWLMTLFEASHQYRGFVADVASICWMAMPWTIAVTAWPVMSLTLLSQILFTEAARLLFLGGPLSTKFAVRFTLLLMASALTYEAFYFQMFPIIVLWALSPISAGQRKRGLLMVGSMACVAQVLPILLNRYVARIATSASKAANTNWKSTFVSNLEKFPGVLEAGLLDERSRSIGWLRWTLVCAVCLVTYGLVRKESRPAVGRILLIVLLAVTSFFISTFIYSIAGYGFAFTGLESRTLYASSWALAILFFALVSSALIRATAILRVGLIVSAAGLIVVLASAQRTALKDWAQVWQQELRILAVAPVVEISRIPKDSGILYLGPSYYKGIAIFGASWDLTAAVFAKKPLSENRKAYRGMITINPATELYNWRWDGAQLIQDLPGYWIQKYPAAHLYVWDYPKSSFHEVQPGFQWPPR